MKVTMAGVFLGVFVGALGYELLQRTRPDDIAKIRQKVSDTVEKFMQPDDLEDTMKPEPEV